MSKDKFETIGELKQYLENRFKNFTQMDLRVKVDMNVVASGVSGALNRLIDRDDVSVDNGIVSVKSSMGMMGHIGEIAITYTAGKPQNNPKRKEAFLSTLYQQESSKEIVVESVRFEVPPYIVDSCSISDAVQMDCLVAMANKEEVCRNQLRLIEDQILSLKMTQQVLRVEARDAAMKKNSAIKSLVTSDTFSSVLGFPANICLDLCCDTADNIDALLVNKCEIGRRILEEMKRRNIWSGDKHDEDTFEGRYIRMLYVVGMSRKKVQNELAEIFGEDRFVERANTLQAELQGICGDILLDYSEDNDEFWDGVCYEDCDDCDERDCPNHKNKGSEIKREGHLHLVH